MLSKKGASKNPQGKVGHWETACFSRETGAKTAPSGGQGPWAVEVSPSLHHSGFRGEPPLVHFLKLEVHSLEGVDWGAFEGLPFLAALSTTWIGLSHCSIDLRLKESITTAENTVFHSVLGSPVEG